MKYLVILPAMVESVATPCIQSLSDSVRSNTLVVDNSPEGFAWKFDVNSEHHPENLGVARSWNLGAKEVVNKGLDYLIILSASIVFEKGMDDFIEKLEEAHERGDYGLEAQFSYHFIAIGRKVFEEIGYFDTNFYPAYYEETDFIRRMELSGIKPVMGAELAERFRVIDGIAAKRQGIALSIKRGGLHVDFLKLQEYFIEKWGDLGGWENEEQRDRMWKHPFNDPSKPLSYFPDRSNEELKKRYGL